jgi:hypothetical protein
MRTMARGARAFIEITDHSLFGLRGSIGTAYRRTSFSSSQGGAQFFNEPSAMTIDASGSPFLASGEANFIWKPKLGQIVKMFAGMFYDSRVPVTPGYGNMGPLQARSPLKRHESFISAVA